MSAGSHCGTIVVLPPEPINGSIISNPSQLQDMCRRAGETRKRNGFFTPTSLVGDIPKALVARDQLIIRLSKIIPALAEVIEASRKHTQAEVDASLNMLISGLEDIYDTDTSVEGMADLAMLNNGDALIGKLGLVVSEIAESIEAIQQNDREHLGEEMADTYIRLNEICDAMEIDITAEIEKKMKVNAGRPFKHGKLSNL